MATMLFCSGGVDAVLSTAWVSVMTSVKCSWRLDCRDAVDSGAWRAASVGDGEARDSIAAGG
jgi:hypothetical protein